LSPSPKRRPRRSCIRIAPEVPGRRDLIVQRWIQARALGRFGLPLEDDPRVLTHRSKCQRAQEHGARRFDVRQRRHAREEFLHPFVAGRLRVTRPDVHREHVRGYEAKIDRSQIDKTAHDEPRSDEEHHGEADLKDQQQGACANGAPARWGTRGIVERFKEVRTAGMPDRLRPTQHRGREHGDERERRDGHVE
jgi:hypothetical protein